MDDTSPMKETRDERRRLAERRVREANGGSRPGMRRGACDGTARFRLSTWVTARTPAGRRRGARLHADGASGDVKRSRVRSRRGNADGILVSAARFAPENVPTLSALVDGFPAHACRARRRFKTERGDGLALIWASRRESSPIFGGRMAGGSSAACSIAGDSRMIHAPSACDHSCRHWRDCGR